MTTTRLFVFALVCGVAVYTTIANRRLNAELEVARAELATASALGSKALGVLVRSSSPDPVSRQANATAGHTTAADACRCESCAPSDPTVIAPDGRNLQSGQELEDWARQRLDRQIAAAFPEQHADGMGKEERQEVVRLLMEFRELRQAQIAQGESGAADPSLRDELFHKQGQFSQLTGMGIGEFLTAIAASEPRVATDILVANPPGAGEERKRFADETARRLGITEPGSREVLDDQGRWQSR